MFRVLEDKGHLLQSCSSKGYSGFHRNYLSWCTKNLAQSQLIGAPLTLPEQLPCKHRQPNLL